MDFQRLLQRSVRRDRDEFYPSTPPTEVSDERRPPENLVPSYWLWWNEEVDRMHLGDIPMHAGDSTALLTR